jgi:hypothetical protein
MAIRGGTPAPKVQVAVRIDGHSISMPSGQTSMENIDCIEFLLPDDGSYILGMGSPAWPWRT